MSIGENLEGFQLQLEIFRRKYLQMLDPNEIDFPMEWFIKLPATQQWIYDHMFNPEKIKILPYPDYAFRILKRLLYILEAAMKDPEEDEISDDLANCFAQLLTRKAKDGLDLIQEKRPITYTAPVLSGDPPTVTILEAPNLLTSNGDTGNRTWDAALFLATFLSTDGRHFVQDKSILELGAGLGFVSVLCGKHLGARHVLVTDASEGVLCTAQQNARLNGIDDIVNTSVLEWGTQDVDRVYHSGDEAVSYDLILGSDMLYQPRDFPALMSTLHDLFSHNPKLQMLISSAVRREETLDSFLNCCKKNFFHVERVLIDPLPEKEQLGFFHSTFYEIHIYLITKQSRLMTNGREFLDLMLGDHEDTGGPKTCVSETKTPQGIRLEPTTHLPNMVGMYPDICSIVPFAPELLRDVEEVGILWLQRNGIDLLRFVNMEVYTQLEIYYSFFTIAIPEFINVDIDDGTGTWRIPIEATQNRGAAAGIGVLMTEIDRQATRGLRSWHIYGHGIGAGIGDIFLKGRLLPVEFEGMMHAEMRPELWMLGKPGAVMCLLYPQELPWGRYSGRPMAGSIRANPNALESSLVGRSPSLGMSPGMSGRRHIDRPLDSFMSRQADRGMDRRMDRGMDRTTRIPAFHGQPAHRQPLAITDNTVASYFSDDTSTESDLSKSESDVPKRRTKTKTAKGKSTVKSAGRGRKETQGRKQSSESESDDEPPEKPKKNVKKDKSVSKAAGRGRSPSDDEVAYSADEQRQKGKAKAPARKRQPEGESQGPSKHGGRRNRGRSPSDDEAPPRVDPTEQARLDALKAQNGYGDGKAEKSGWH